MAQLTFFLIIFIPFFFQKITSAILQRRAKFTPQCLPPKKNQTGFGGQSQTEPLHPAYTRTARATVAAQANSRIPPKWRRSDQPAKIHSFYFYLLLNHTSLTPYIPYTFSPPKPSFLPTFLPPFLNLFLSPATPNIPNRIDIKHRDSFLPAQ